MRGALLGGAGAAVENGYMKQELVGSLTRRSARIESGEDTIVGVNAYLSSEPSPLQIEGKNAVYMVDPDVEAEAARQQRRALLGRGQVPSEQDDTARGSCIEVFPELRRDFIALKPHHHDRRGEGLDLIDVPGQGVPPRRTIVFRIISESDAPGLSFRYIL